MSELLLGLFFIVIIFFQATHKKEILIFERKTTGMYIAIVIGCLIVLGITLYYGSTFVHMITGLLGIIMLINSLFVTGLSKDSFFYYSPPKRLVGQKVLFNDSTKIRVETFHQFLIHYK